MSPPPGWYPDPSAPHLQRWWDGTTWTEHRAPAAAPTAPVPPPSAGGGGTGRAKVVALIAAGAVLVAAIVTGGLYLGRGDDGDGEDVRSVPNPATSGVPPTTDTPSPSVSTSEPSADDPAVVTDQLNGITLPLPDGWVRPQYVTEDDVVMTTDGTYDCPGDSGVCRHGLVISRTATGNDGSSPEALAKKDISDAADAAYDRDLVGRRPFGGIESHQQVASGQIAVAGRAGYYVRWRVKTAKGPGGYVESLAFPSSVGTEAPVLVRFVFDAGEDGPPLTDMDKITRGIRSIDDAATGGGVGSSIGPTD
ncbi:DUF2510 domain-containing protein [Streptomyces sp. HGB0020]|uniref:DUF2510 domain-containing protein n=1 Tax=Streptomyces sp. HGB0020 TaxID=1078086 RepID=UPI0005673275|nr:DUF2510 domain-containing protein [Streptomyces sp. HGB0020]